MNNIRGTTVIGLHHQGEAVIASDGQVTMGHTILKGTAAKVRKLYEDRILAGFAGSTADAFTLFEKFETKIKACGGDLTRAAVELAKEWRTDKYLGKLDALLVVMDKTQGFIISGSGDVISSDDGIYTIGSGGSYALSAARALKDNSNLPTREIVEKSLKIAGDICIYTNNNITVLEL